MKTIFLVKAVTGFVIGFVLTHSNPAIAERTHTKKTKAQSIESLIAEIIEHNPELQVYQEEIAAAKGEGVIAATWTNPELSTELGNKRVSGDGDSDNGLAWSLSLQQPIEWPGRVELRELIAKKKVEMAELGLSQFKIVVASKARTLAYDLAAAEEKARAAREVGESYQRLIRVLSQRETAGVSPLLERRILETTALSVERKVTEAELEAKAVKLKINQLRGKELHSPVELSPPTSRFAAAPKPEVLFATAQNNNFELLLKKVELSQQGLKVDLARNEQYPSFSVGPYFSRERATDREVQAGIGIVVPLPFWNQNAGQINIEEARRSQTAASVLVAERELERKIAENVEIYTAKLAELKKWEGSLLRDVKEAAGLADKHFRQGSLPIGTYLEVQNQYLGAVESLLSAKSEALHAQQEIETLTGEPLNSNNL